MKLFKVLAVSALAISIISISGCGDDIKYGNVDSTATGSIDFSQDVPEVEIDNIISGVGEEIDYTSQIEVNGEEDLSDFQISVNTTDVNTEVPGTYNATYTITYDSKTYTKQIKVTVEGDSEVTTATTAQTTTEQPSQGTQETESVTTVQSDGNITVKVELLSGETVNIKCTPDRFVISTRTDYSTMTRDGVDYNVEKLIVTYNTGAEQVLETIEKKIN